MNRFDVRVVYIDMYGYTHSLLIISIFYTVCLSACLKRFIHLGGDFILKIVATTRNEAINPKLVTSYITGNS